MSRIKKKFIKLTNDSDGLNGQGIPANFTPSNYTPSEVASEGTDKQSAHLKGIDAELAKVSGSSTDIADTSFSLSNNQSTAADITGFTFANASVRSFDALVSVVIDATADLYESFKLLGIQKGSGWDLSVNNVGDQSEIEFSITSAGQVQYTSGNYAGFSSGTIKFRAITTSV